MKLRFGARLTSPILLFAVQQGKRPGNPVGGKAQPNSKGKFTRAGSVLGRSTEDVNDHYHFHEVGARTVTLRHDSRAPVLAPFRFQIARDASRGATTPDAARYPDAVSSRPGSRARAVGRSSRGLTEATTVCACVPGGLLSRSRLK